MPPIPLLSLLANLGRVGMGAMNGLGAVGGGIFGIQAIREALGGSGVPEAPVDEEEEELRRMLRGRVETRSEIAARIARTRMGAEHAG